MANYLGFSGITALYERLSRDDEQQGESNSIVNQKQYLEDYAKQNGFSRCVHYTDDGYTGRNFKRPGFQKLLKDIDEGNIGIDDAWEDRIVITDHNVHYEFKPETPVKPKPISWTAKTFNPAYIDLFYKLSNVVLKRIEAPPLEMYCDIGDITLSVVFSDKRRKTQSYGVPPEELEPCFSIMKQMVNLVTKAPGGMLYEEEYEEMEE